MTAPLPLPDDPRVQALIKAWPPGWPNPPWRNRAHWLHDFEAILREHYPQAISDELTLTARLAAPFPLAKPGVP